MKTIQERIDTYDWEKITDSLHDRGFAMVTNLINDAECEALKEGYMDANSYRKTVPMERYRFGKGEYKYYDYPLPELISTLRENVYPKLVPIANRWMEVLGITTRYPNTHQELKMHCHDHGQTKPTALILKYSTGGYNTLHQDLYGAVFFPMQIVLMLNQPGTDYTGGELVMTEQLPRAQSRANVLIPNKGDMLIFTTNFRPAKGTRGYYRIQMKHGVSTVHSGDRHSLGIIFHDGQR